jgi:hypothetical protein
MKSSKRFISLFSVITMVFAMTFTVSATSHPKTSGNYPSVVGSSTGNLVKRDKTDKLSVALIASWYTLQKKVNAMFGKDPGIVVTNLTGSGQNCKIDINVNDAAKATAIKTIIKSPVSFGSTLVTINVYGPDGKAAEQSNLDPSTTLKNAFTGNPIFQGVEVSAPNCYCVFSKPVIQFFNDDLSSYKGYYCAMTSDVAKDVLATNIKGTNISYCISIS